MSFVVAAAKGSCFVDLPIMIARDALPTWKWSTAEERTSVIRLLAELRPSRIVIGGDAPEAIPVVEYERPVAQFPTPHERRLYVQSRLAYVRSNHRERAHFPQPLRHVPRAPGRQPTDPSTSTGTRPSRS